MDLFESKSIAPMLIAEEKLAFDNPDWIYELKLDGIRCVAYLDRSGAVYHNKRGNNVTAIYPELGMAHKQAKKRCILDGEVFILKNGKPNFAEVQRRALMTNGFKINLAAAKLPVSFVAFDILYLDGEQLTDRPLMERKELLQKTLAESERLAVSRYIEQSGSALYDAAEKQGLEGIVAKRKDSFYYFGKQTKDWVKCKALLDEDFVVCGYYYKGNLASIILGAYRDQKLIYQSHVVMGVSKQDFKIIASQPFTSKSRYPGFPDFDRAIWIAPSLVCTVKYMERTSRGGLRQPVFKGLREDKAAEDCVV
jgi:bifunctional non-homologous end joining protein LigD/DNA ligase-1